MLCFFKNEGAAAETSAERQKIDSRRLRQYFGFSCVCLDAAPSSIDGMSPIKAMDLAPVIPANEMNTYADTAITNAQVDFIHRGGSSSSETARSCTVLTMAAIVVELLANVTNER